MKRLFLTSALCLSLTACESVGLDNLTSWNPFGGSDQVAESEPLNPAITVNQSALQTELAEMQKLTGTTPRVMTTPVAPTMEQMADSSPVAPADMTPLDEIDAKMADIESDVMAETVPEAEVTAPVSEPIAEQVEVIAPVPSEVNVAEPAVTPEPEQVTVTKTQPELDTPIEVATVAPSGCPQIVILPTTRSVTNFEDGNIGGAMTARAAITDVRGGCEVVDGGMEVDLDILMRGRITDKGRFEGKRNEEAFITFPYFTSVVTPQGTPVEKQILATAMRFRPLVDDLEHAEKITQFIPMDDLGRSAEYQIMVGFQLTREQLNYNKAVVEARPDNDRVSPDTSPAQRRSYNPLAVE